MNPKILIIDDDKKLQSLLKQFLENHFYSIFTSYDGKNAENLIEDQRMDLVILDLMLKNSNGLEILKKIRTKYTTPVIILSGKGEETDRILGLELGADDYISKPFNPRELLARINALLRRTNQNLLQKESNSHIIQFQNIILNKNNFTVIINQEPVNFTTTEFLILLELIKNKGKILSRELLLQLSTNKENLSFDRSIDVHISKIRSKLQIDSKHKNRIKSIWGVGYMFVDET